MKVAFEMRPIALVTAHAPKLNHVITTSGPCSFSSTPRKAGGSIIREDRQNRWCFLSSSSTIGAIVMFFFTWSCYFAVGC